MVHLKFTLNVLNQRQNIIKNHPMITDTLKTLRNSMQLTQKKIKSNITKQNNTRKYLQNILHID